MAEKSSTFDFRLRDPDDIIANEADEIIRSPLFADLLRELPSMILILNSSRQIIYINKRLSEEFNIGSESSVLGKRPGECLLCIHAGESRHGCGSTDYCSVCGFARSVSKSERGMVADGECNFTVNNGETLTYSVHTQPFNFKENTYIFAYLQDISEVKTRQMLENLFLHDINNSITVLNGLNEMIDVLPANRARNIINDLSVRLNNEVNSYRLITEAESRQLSLMISEVNLDQLIKSIVKSLTSIKNFHKRKIRVDTGQFVLQTDETLLRRVLINGVMNALEASSDNQEVHIYTSVGDDRKTIVINIKSHPLIPRDVKLQLFQRSFTTKGTGRGWGTYSIRLLTEKYLGGRVSFVSNHKERTVFRISVPSLDRRRYHPERPGSDPGRSAGSDRPS